MNLCGGIFSAGLMTALIKPEQAAPVDGGITHQLLSGVLSAEQPVVFSRKKGASSSSWSVRLYVAGIRELG